MTLKKRKRSPGPREGPPSKKQTLGDIQQSSGSRDTQTLLASSSGASGSTSRFKGSLKPSASTFPPAKAFPMTSSIVKETTDLHTSSGKPKKSQSHSLQSLKAGPSSLPRSERVNDDPSSKSSATVIRQSYFSLFNRGFLFPVTQLQGRVTTAYYAYGRPSTYSSCAQLQNHPS